MKHQNKEILQMMRRHDQNGSNFANETVCDWYRARRYVLDNFNSWTGGRIGPNSSDSFKIVIDGHSSLVYSVVRHIALIAHFSNFDEEKQEKYSTITILYPKEYKLKDLEAEINILAKEEFLFNLIKYSFYTLIDAEGNSKSNDNWLPFLDIKFMLIATDCYNVQKNEKYLSQNDIEKSVGNNKISSFTDDELTAAMLVNQAYSAGDEIIKLNSTEKDTADKYNIALDCLNGSKKKNVRESWQTFFSQNVDGKIELTHKEEITNILSCIFCADTFESRLYELIDIPDRIKYKFLIANAKVIKKAFADNFHKLSKSEHARWNAEKLILGFRPFSEEESFIDEVSFDNRNSYRKSLKRRFPYPSHIDILSSADLKRINPEDQKYDRFIMLAIPTILMQKYRLRFLRRFFRVS